MELDPEITQIQDDFARRVRPTSRWIIVQEPEGYSVHEHTINDVAPSTDYRTKEEAAARVLQLLGIKTPVTPQNWPERVEIGHIERR